ncbi:hypothetical protein OH76DRAFT_1398366 [Lentinus brumalis]|uniref:DUF6533 domain-containing protein n=1 Tax=Lentinus brumalis TaxID=2498619 RepID=A0A371DNF0_9APHY|nr:hypothetical protein OH76DRAFT_1398366 [Polyporus brumalis]
MSVNATASAAAIASQLDGLTLTRSATIVLFIYEALVTSDREVACFWTANKRSGATFLFYANRGISMTLYIMDMANYAPFPSDEFGKAAVQIAQFIPGAAFSALRAFVLSRSKLLGVLVLALSLAPVGANLVHYGYQVSGAIIPFWGCIDTDNTTEALNLRFGHLPVVIISRVPLILADVLLVYITWTNISSRDTLTVVRASKRLSLSDILFRDGTDPQLIVSSAMSILNVIHLTFSVTAVSCIDNQRTSLPGSLMHSDRSRSWSRVQAMSASSAPRACQSRHSSIFPRGYALLTHGTLPGSITAILVSRFLLELQEANQTVVRLDRDDPLHTSRDPYDSTPTFISSLGAFINPDLPALQDDDYELHGVGSRSRLE